LECCKIDTQNTYTNTHYVLKQRRPWVNCE